MFGIMRPEGGCSHKQDPNYRFHRMHYCGVCKAMGNSYGHKTRFLLNFDIVFLAELLSEWSEQDLSQWGGAYQAINRCFTMPKGETPVSLQYAADANLFLSELKIEDHAADTGRLSWRFARWFYSGSFLKATKHLEKWGIDQKELSYWANQQAVREAAVPTEKELSSFIEYFAEPTAQLSSLIFRQGAIAVGKAEISEQAALLGYRFGLLAYLLDAFEDIEKDAFQQQFNPLLLYFNAERTLSEAELELTRTFIYSTQDSIQAALGQLRLAPEKVDLYFSRLRSNIAMQLYRERTVPLRFRERISARWQQARDFARQLTCDSPKNLATNLRYQMLSVAVFVAPRTPEYMGISNNSAVVFTWTAFLAAFIAAIGLGVIVGKKRKAKKKKKRSFKKMLEQLRKGELFKGGCWEQICAACCTACACACCESCCENGCDNCLDNACNGCDDCENNTWIWILLAFAVIVIGVTVLLFVLL